MKRMPPNITRRLRRFSCVSAAQNRKLPFDRWFLENCEKCSVLWIFDLSEIKGGWAYGLDGLFHSIAFDGRFDDSACPIHCHLGKMWILAQAFIHLLLYRAHNGRWLAWIEIGKRFSWPSTCSKNDFLRLPLDFGIDFAFPASIQIAIRMKGYNEMFKSVSWTQKKHVNGSCSYDSGQIFDLLFNKCDGFSLDGHEQQFQLSQAKRWPTNQKTSGGETGMLRKQIVAFGRAARAF